jgi:NAD+ diphosphatase
MNFTPGIDFHYRPDRGRARPYIFQGDRLLVKTTGGSPLPVEAADLNPPVAVEGERLGLGLLGDAPCWTQRCPREWQPPGHLAFKGLRGLFGRLADAEMAAAGYGLQILNWFDAHRYCGRCGAPTALGEGERALACRGCCQTLFPKMTPAVIVAVVSRNRILLARAGRFPGRMFSVIAGYVEPGETLEACVRREVREEVGIAIDDIRYFGSQPWPFTGSLMVAFTAAHAGGEIAVDNKEIVEAGWFTAAGLPEIPGKISIARQLIDWYVARYGPKTA